MQNRSADKQNEVCEKLECDYNFPVMRPHKHVVTPDGQYVKFIVEKPQQSR